jgi:hypothetical protein
LLAALPLLVGGVLELPFGILAGALRGGPPGVLGFCHDRSRDSKPAS